MRGVPDVAFQASAGTGALIYLTLPPDGDSGLLCGTTPCSTGWYDIGGTSLATPQWAGIVALADQVNALADPVNGGGLGLINPALYKIGADPTRYAADFYDITTGNNTVDPTTPPADIRLRPAGNRSPASARRTPSTWFPTSWRQSTATDTRRPDFRIWKVGGPHRASHLWRGKDRYRGREDRYSFRRVEPLILRTVRESRV